MIVIRKAEDIPLNKLKAVLEHLKKVEADPDHPHYRIETKKSLWFFTKKKTIIQQYYWRFYGVSFDEESIYQTSEYDLLERLVSSLQARYCFAVTLDEYEQDDLDRILGFHDDVMERGYV